MLEDDEIEADAELLGETDADGETLGLGVGETLGETLDEGDTDADWLRLADALGD